jgi:tetratricopeptide (TPR) repeat protein
MYHNASLALEKEMRHPTARVYAAFALLKSESGYPLDTYYGATEKAMRMGNLRARAIKLLREAIKIDPLNHLARFSLTLALGKGRGEFFASLRSDVAQTALDIGYDLMRAGLIGETVTLMKSALSYANDKTMLRYTLAYCYDKIGDGEAAEKQRRAARRGRIVDFFPIRAEEATVLEAALEKDEKDGFAAYLLGCIRYNFREYEKAAALWESAVENIADFYIPYRNLALVYFNHLGREGDAITLMLKAIKLKAGDAMLLGELETVMRKSGYSPNETAKVLEERRPEEDTDQMMLTLARAYNGAGRFEDAERIMLSHTFSPGEGAELITAEPYIFSCFARGRVAFAEGRYNDALKLFKMAQTMPENLNVGFWNESIMMPYLYFEAATLKKLGRDEEADVIIKRLATLRDVGMWNMGGEFVYYFASAISLGGDEMRAKNIIRDAILAWEKELEGGCVYHKKIGTLYNCFVGDGARNRRGELYAMLGFADLFLGRRKEAKDKFEKSYSLDPTAKVAFEISLLR